MITHLGSGKDYQTPLHVEKLLLESVPRSINREQYDIKFPFCFVGQDVWNCYEFSCLINEWPITGVLKIVYGAGSTNIVESKSLKLYLNSFNMVNFHSKDEIIEKVRKDLRPHLGEVQLYLHLYEPDQEVAIDGDFKEFKFLEPKMERHLKESPELLVSNPRTVYGSNYYTNLLRSNCRVTGQPDWADCYIHMKPNTISSYRLIQYLLSFRNENHFHEEVCEMIYKRLWDIAQPDELFVGCLYTRRGGIDINPVRASSISVLDRYSKNLTNPYVLTVKSMRH